jgi:hypothetical protein
MKTSVALLLVAAFATPALAQPGADEPVPVAQPSMAPPPPVIVVTPAPQNEDWNNVSHVNGHPVPVGERGNYLYKWKKTNVATNPIGWIFGIYGVSVSQAVSDNIAIRGDANIVSFESTSGYEFGASVPIYFKRVFQGPFIEPGLLIRGSHDSYDDEYCDYDCMDDNTFVGPEVMFGWHWTFDSGLNAAIAVGAARDLDKKEYGDSIQPAGYFRVGYAF